MIDFYIHPLHDFQNYEESHARRYNHLVKDLELDKIIDKKVVDLGYGLGNLAARFTNNNLYYTGIDYTDENNLVVKPTRYFKRDINYPFADEIKKEIGLSDIGFCFELLEHLTGGPYIALRELKSLIIEDGIIYLSIPTIESNHPFIYRGLFIKEHFEQFLEQMSLEIFDYRLHTAAFSQHVYTLINRHWKYSKMTPDKAKFEEKYRGVLPEVAVNL